MQYVILILILCHDTLFSLIHITLEKWDALQVQSYNLKNLTDPSYTDPSNISSFISIIFNSVLSTADLTKVDTNILRSPV